ncbi:GNAT family N-acetyltransferase [Aestuariibius sp. 2305UL40-4]|uniref:GNAT family N-acetyltransferase n=1 Tax=Aestuariibius violaceus TaxID=3234132 RepID=UPI00345E7BE8
MPNGPDGLRIAELRADDAPQILPLCHMVQRLHVEKGDGSFREMSDAEWLGHLNTMIDGQGTGILAAWLGEGPPAGYLIHQIEDTAKHPFRDPYREGYIQQIAVAEAHHRRGIGTALINAALSLFAEADATRWRASWWDFNAASAALFAKLTKDAAVTTAMGPVSSQDFLENSANPNSSRRI